MAGIILIKPIEKTKWHAKKGHESFTRPHSVKALVDAENYVYQTGLNYKDKNYTLNGDKVTEVQYYENLLKVDLSNQFQLDTPHPFWDTKAATLLLENKTMALDTRRPLEYIKYRIAKESKFVANSISEYDEGYFPEATHVIYDEEQEVEVQAKKIELIDTAKEKVNKLSESSKLSLILALTGDADFTVAKNYKHKSANSVKVELNKIIERDPSKVVNFLGLGKDLIQGRAIIIEALQKNVLRKIGLRVMYFDAIIGEDVDDAVGYINDPKNQEFRVRILESINK